MLWAVKLVDGKRDSTGCFTPFGELVEDIQEVTGLQVKFGFCKNHRFKVMKLLRAMR